MLDRQDPATVFTVVDATAPAVDIGDRVVLDGDWMSVTDRDPIPDDELPVDFEAWSDSLSDVGGSASSKYSTDNGDVIVFADHLEPVPRLLFFGSQNDVNPVARIGREAGFEVIVASPRGAQSSTDEFPCPHDVAVSHPTEITRHVDDETCVVLMSHNFLDDRLALETLLEESEAPYVGLTGSRERFQEMLDEFVEEGTEFTDDQLGRASTPVSLDLGGGEPIQIAISIVSEVLAVSNDRSRGRLKEREDPIYDRIEQTSPS